MKYICIINIAGTWCSIASKLQWHVCISTSTPWMHVLSVLIESRQTCAIFNSTAWRMTSYIIASRNIGLQLVITVHLLPNSLSKLMRWNLHDQWFTRAIYPNALVWWAWDVLTDINCLPLHSTDCAIATHGGICTLKCAIRDLKHTFQPIWLFERRVIRKALFASWCSIQCMW